MTRRKANEGAQAASMKRAATVEEDAAKLIAAIDVGRTNNGKDDPDMTKDDGDGDGNGDGDGDGDGDVEGDGNGNGDRDSNGDGDGKIHRREEGNLNFILIENR